MAQDKLYKFKPMLGPAEEWPIGSPQWAERISNRLQTNTRMVTKNTASALQDLLKQILAVTPRAWEVFPSGRAYGTPEDWCQKVSGHSWRALLCTVAELTGDPDLRRALEVENAEAQVKVRGQGARTDLLQAEGMKLGAQGSNSSQKRLRRLARRAPDVLARYEAGEFPSVAAASRAAGFNLPPTPFEEARRQLRRLLPKLTPAERAELRKML